ncbi:hypothetical protein B0T14DRAFT_508673 [Immersiella caudata]|uniref:Uncharacterized protein n=1 Tax=Immersiella caudata TaxID=314043 RepID=A0AA40C5I9_9PEZI|nr:hypothetical protein B0T14DRAFT_508673 [Immersiella caudata]
MTEPTTKNLVKPVTDGESPWTKELQAAFEALRVAAEISRTVQKMTEFNGKDAIAKTQDSDSLAIKMLKSDATPVTIADLAIQAMLLTVLNVTFPTYGLVAEESADQLRNDPELRAIVNSLIVDHARDNTYAWENGCFAFSTNDTHVIKILDLAGDPNGDGTTKPTFWVMDPIDGTASFVKGQQYAINLALISDGVEQLSAIACPLVDFNLAKTPLSKFTDATVPPASHPGTFLYAALGEGSYIMPLDASQSPIRLPNIPPNAVSRPYLSTTATAVTSGKQDLHQQIATSLGATHPYCDLLAWVLRWVSLALQHATYTVWIYKNPNRHAKIWDHAGAMLLFREVGGKITDVNGREMDLSTGRTMSGNRGFVAASEGEHAAVLAEVRRVMGGEQ